MSQAIECTDLFVELLREADHRIANQLTVTAEMLKSQIGQVRRGPETLDRDDVCQILQDAVGKVTGIAHLHRMLANHARSETVDIGDLLIAMIREVVTTLSLREKLRVSQKLGSGCVVDKWQAQKLSLIVVEIVMNAIKHAHPTGVSIEFTVACDRLPDGGIVLELNDDGVGLPEGFDVARDGGVGFRVIRTLAHELGATLQIESDYLGLSFRLQLPQHALAAAAGR